MKMVRVLCLQEDLMENSSVFYEGNISHPLAIFIVTITSCDASQVLMAFAILFELLNE